MKHAVLFLALCLPSVGLAAAEPELKGTLTELSAYVAGQQNHAVLVGEAEVKMPADRAVVTLRLNSEHKSLKEGSLANQKLRLAITAYLAENSIGADRIHSAKFASTPQTGTFSDKVKSYRFESRLLITIRDDAEFQTVSGAVEKWSNVSYEGVEFAHSDKEALRLKAIGMACDHALARKKTYEEKLGVKLSVKRFSEGASLIPSLSSGLFPQAGTAPSYVTGQAVGYDYGLGNSMMRGLAPAGTGATSVGFGELTFTARVVLDCAVEAR